MINPKQLLQDLKRRLSLLEDDLRERITEVPELEAALRAEWQAAHEAGRCDEPFATWAEQVQTQAAVHWLLSCVFLRFIEDNHLVERPWLAGSAHTRRLHLARDRHEAYFQQHPLDSDRDYLLHCFSEAGSLPGLETFFDANHNPVFRLGISGRAAIELRQFWQQQDPDSGELLHDFSDPEWNTRFLGDLYQDLSEATRKRYALLQTPEFVEEFILDRTLSPALREFGYQHTKMIDPTCGSGHFLLGGFARMLDAWSRAELQANRRYLAQKALDAVAGVDLNPFAVAISRFRLLLAALKASDVHLLAHAPNFKIHVAIGDSLLHGKRFGMKETEDMFQDSSAYADTGLAHAYASEDLEQVQKILGQQYQAVVGNPPYIVVKDAALSAAYRKRYASCHRQYSLGVPFTERFFELAVTGDLGQVKSVSELTDDSNGDDDDAAPVFIPGRVRGAGYVGLITANSFMKREFGSKLIEEVLPKLDLTHVVDTSGAYIPGHGTPTVILFGRHRKPVAQEVRTVMGIKGEPSTPEDPAQGQVWSAIVGQIDQPGSESEFVSVAETVRASLFKHPWSVSGGGASGLREKIEHQRKTIDASKADIGYHIITGEDNCLLLPDYLGMRDYVPQMRLLGEGDAVRNWTCASTLNVIWPYDESGQAIAPLNLAKHLRFLWPFRANLKSRKLFGTSIEEKGLKWYDLREVYSSRLTTLPTIAFSEVATHPHFIFERGTRVFKQTAPIIKLPATASEDEHLGLVGLLNSSVACFWFQQVCHNKGGPGGGSSKDEKWHDFYAFNSTKVAEFPLAATRPLEWARSLDSLANELRLYQPQSLLDPDQPLPNRETLSAAKLQTQFLRNKMIAAQEELDWQSYRLYDVLPAGSTSLEYEDGTPPAISLGERAFEILMARRMAKGLLETRWFEWLQIQPVTVIPAHWPQDYARLVEKRIALIESDRNIALIESFNCKRRWESPSWESLEQTALRDWLLARLETERYWPRATAELSTTYKLSELARQDADFVQVAALYAGHADVDLAQLIAELVQAESVPLPGQLRYTDSGLRKRVQWEDTWDLQRQEDAISQELDAAHQQELTQELAALALRYAATAEESPEQQAARLEQHSNAEAALRAHLQQRHAQLRQQALAQKVGKIPVPPKYVSKDFQKADYWRLRGALDVAKERWHSLPGCERSSDSSLVIGWAGWDHLQLATAIASYYLQVKDHEGWDTARLLPLLVSLLEILPWLQQWHNDIHPEFQIRMGDYYAGVIADEAKALGTTLADLRAWQPPVAVKGRKKKGNA